MSLTIKLRKCLSEPQRLTKIFTSNVDIELTGNFKDKEDILKPVITVETTYDISMYNYCEIAAFGRKYFIEVQADYNNIWTLKCNVDVLSTYETEIKACDAIVKRSESKPNYYINDGTFFTEQRQVITYHTFKKNNPTTHAYENAKLGTESYYLLVAGG